MRAPVLSTVEKHEYEIKHMLQTTNTLLTVYALLVRHVFHKQSEDRFYFYWLAREMVGRLSLVEKYLTLLLSVMQVRFCLAL